ncbi:hypothetical protein H0H87_000325, partial [Tephrocybe sp. NHM501043]
HRVLVSRCGFGEPSMPPRLSSTSTPTSNRLSAVYIGHAATLPDLPSPPSPSPPSSPHTGLPSPPATNSTGSASGDGPPAPSPTPSRKHTHTHTRQNSSISSIGSISTTVPRSASIFEEKEPLLLQQDEDEDVTERFSVSALQRVRSLAQRNRLVRGGCVVFFIYFIHSWGTGTGIALALDGQTLARTIDELPLFLRRLLLLLIRAPLSPPTTHRTIPLPALRLRDRARVHLLPRVVLVPAQPSPHPLLCRPAPARPRQGRGIRIRVEREAEEETLRAAAGLDGIHSAGGQHAEKGEPWQRQEKGSAAC